MCLGVRQRGWSAGGHLHILAMAEGLRLASHALMPLGMGDAGPFAGRLLVPLRMAKRRRQAA